MSKRTRTAPKTGPVWHMSAEEATLAKKPHYNAHICKTGAHGDAKYNREKAKRAWNRELNREGAFRGPFPLYAHNRTEGAVSGDIAPLIWHYGDQEHWCRRAPRGKEGRRWLIEKRFSG